MSGQPVELTAGTELFADSVKRAKSRQLSPVDLFKSAAALEAAGQLQLAAELYKTWIAHHADHGLLYAVHFNCGVAHTAIRDHAAAAHSLRETIRLKPDFHPAYINLGRVLEESGQPSEAVEQWLKLVHMLPAINGDAVAYKLTALQQTGRVLEAAKRDAAAEEALKLSLDINANQTEIAQHWISLRMKQCKWPVIAEWERVSRKQLLTEIDPLALECLADDPMFQLAKGFHHGKMTVGMPKATSRPLSVANRRDPHQLRIGYVSSDLRGHAVGYAMTDVIEQHNRENFEIFAYYCGIKHTDATQQRIMKSVDHWIDINDLNDDAAAAKIAADGIDILVDLNGYTKDARTKVFARRPAPIAANWFGFPGTMGTPYHHYIIADSNTIPLENEIYFSEKVVRLPCYQANDRKRVIAPRRPSRAEVGLPENSFVYCSFNGMQKITPRVFQRWMTILRQVPDSVLWLLEGTDDTNARLQKAAGEYGVSPERIVIAKRLPNAEHLARYPLADLFLDSMPYGAHTTAADSLWMNVPVLTLPGRSFASRVCTSVVRSAGVPELECQNPEAYIARAVELGLDREKLAAIKAKLAAGRDSCLLFDTPRLVSHLEDLYQQMWSEFKRGELPVPDLRNLEIYHEIGVALELENMELLSDDEYVSLYQNRLAERHSLYPIEPDNRMWRKLAPAERSDVGRLAVA
jgi:predicted O-linked N-acetylglucosamine transferase (SPINDLY family)